VALSKRASGKWKSFAIPVSYRVGETANKLSDARNVYATSERLDTRFGFSRFISTPISGLQSLSFFKDVDNEKYVIAKAGSSLYSIDENGAKTEVYSGVDATEKHRGLTLNNRHVVAAGSTGLLSYDGTVVDKLGLDPPLAPTTTLVVSSGSIADGEYEISYTFYSSTTGFETNNGNKADAVTVATPDSEIAVTNIISNSTNSSIDKIRIYMSKDSGSSLFIAELPLGTTNYSITVDSSNTSTPPTTHGKPLAGGAKYLTEFNAKLAYAGNSTFKNDVWFSEQYLPDAFDNTATQTVLNISGDGDITGLATGFYNNSVLDPFLVIFKKTSTHIYSEREGFARLVTLNQKIGCVSNETIEVKNGAVFWLSTQGWRAIIDGIMVSKDDNPITLANGDIDDIFKRPGWANQVNTSKFSDFFSVYYPVLDQYITFVAEGGNIFFKKAYVYQFEVGGFYPYEFNLNFVDATSGEDSANDETVFLADTSGYIYTHSIKEDRTDVDSNNAIDTISAYAHTIWLDGDDLDASFNFREFLVRSFSRNTMTIKVWIDYDDLSDSEEHTYTFDDSTGIIIGTFVFGDTTTFGQENKIVTARSDINRVGENIRIGLYQEAVNANMALVRAQLDFSKNGNRN